MYFPLRNAGFALNDRRFNVATSRSRTTTLILSDFDLLSMRSITGKVREFLEEVAGMVHEERLEAVPQSSEDIVLIKQKVPADIPHLQAALDDLQVELTKWLEEWLPVVYPENTWRDGVIRKLTELQYRTARQAGAQSLDDLDLSAIATVFIGSFRELSERAEIPAGLQTLAFHIRDIRNVNAHKKTKDIIGSDEEEIRYNLDTVSRFLAGLAKSVKPEPAKPAVVIQRGGITIRAK